MKEKIKNAYSKAKNHVVENREIYITGGACLILGAIGGCLASDNIKVDPKAIIVGHHNVIDQSTQIVVTRKGHPGKAIFDPSTGKQYASINEAASQMDLTRGQVRSRIDSGKLQHLGDALPN